MKYKTRLPRREEMEEVSAGMEWWELKIQKKFLRRMESLGIMQMSVQ